MSDKQEDANPVRLNPSSLEVWGLQGSGRSARLEGAIDDTWADSFDLCQHTQGHPNRFYLDRKRHVLVFSTEDGEDPRRRLEDAQALVDLTNLHTGRVIPTTGAPAPPQDAEIHESAIPLTAPEPEPVKRRSREATRLSDTRDSSRVEASHMVQFFRGESVDAGSAFTGMTRDLSDGGLFVVTNRLPHVGERLSLKIHLGTQKRIDLKGEVVRVLEGEEARRRQLRPGFATRVDASGNQFLRLLVRNQL